MTIKKNQSANLISLETVGNPKTYEAFMYSMTCANSGRYGTELSDQLRKRFPKWSAKWHLLNGFAALKPGSTIFVVIRKHSRTGYSKNISLYTFVIRDTMKLAGEQPITDSTPWIQTATLTYLVGQLLGYNVHNFEGRDIIRVDDYPQEFVANLSQALFGKSNALNCEVL